MTGQIRLAMLFGAALALFCTAGCGSGPGAGTVIAFGEDEAMRTVGAPVSVAEFMLYSVDVKTAGDGTVDDGFYERIGISASGAALTNENIVKEGIAESIRTVRVLCAAAGESGASLSADEERILKENAGTYHRQMTEAGVDEAFLSEETVERFVRETYLAGKVYARMESLRGDTEDIPALLERYDGSYSSRTSINWELLTGFSLQGS